MQPAASLASRSITLTASLRAGRRWRSQSKTPIGRLTLQSGQASDMGFSFDNLAAATARLKRACTTNSTLILLFCSHSHRRPYGHRGVFHARPWVLDCPTLMRLSDEQHCSRHFYIRRTKCNYARGWWRWRWRRRSRCCCDGRVRDDDTGECNCLECQEHLDDGRRLR
jgi:hypothetical protein